MTGLAQDDITRMRDQLFFDGPERNRRLSRFWLLLPLAAVIASAGVVSDSTATVIGAMIVAPLMTPILGIVLAVALTDGPNLRRCLLLVIAGAAAVVAVGWLLGLLVPYPVVAQTNAQVAARTTLQVADLVAALATGAVGSVALVRSDISDTLPGVAIAISLVPPLAVVGLTLESGAPRQSLAALLLFTTNVAAILASGIVVMALYRVRRPHPAGRSGRPLSRRRRHHRRPPASDNRPLDHQLEPDRPDHHPAKRRPSGGPALGQRRKLVGDRRHRHRRPGADPGHRAEPRPQPARAPPGPRRRRPERPRRARQPGPGQLQTPARIGGGSGMRRNVNRRVITSTDEFLDASLTGGILPILVRPGAIHAELIHAHLGPLVVDAVYCSLPSSS